MVTRCRDRRKALRSLWSLLLTLLGAWCLGTSAGEAMELPQVTVTAPAWEEASLATPGTVSVLRPEASEGEG